MWWDEIYGEPYGGYANLNSYGDLLPQPLEAVGGGVPTDYTVPKAPLTYDAFQKIVEAEEEWLSKQKHGGRYDVQDIYGDALNAPQIQQTMRWNDRYVQPSARNYETNFAERMAQTDRLNRETRRGNQTMLGLSPESNAMQSILRNTTSPSTGRDISGRPTLIVPEMQLPEYSPAKNVLPFEGLPASQYAQGARSRSTGQAHASNPRIPPPPNQNLPSSVLVNTSPGQPNQVLSYTSGGASGQVWDQWKQAGDRDNFRAASVQEEEINWNPQFITKIGEGKVPVYYGDAARPSESKKTGGGYTTFSDGLLSHVRWVVKNGKNDPRYAKVYNEIVKYFGENTEQIYGVDKGRNTILKPTNYILSSQEAKDLGFVNSLIYNKTDQKSYSNNYEVMKNEAKQRIQTLIGMMVSHFVDMNSGELLDRKNLQTPYDPNDRHSVAMWNDFLKQKRGMAWALSFIVGSGKTKM